MFLYGVLPTAAVLVGIIVWLAAAMYDALRVENEQDMQVLADRVAAEIERGNTCSVLASRGMATALMNGMFGDRAASVAYAEQVLADHPELTGAYFGYEPDADGQDARALQTAAAVERVGKSSPASRANDDGNSVDYPGESGLGPMRRGYRAVAGRRRAPAPA